jgi:hypothetical protein
MEGRGGKNDMTDAAAICEAASRPTMRFVPVKSCEQQGVMSGGRRRIAIDEDVIGLGSYGKTLTVLYNINVPEPEEEEDEAALIESWTPRFRR